MFIYLLSITFITRYNLTPYMCKVFNNTENYPYKPNLISRTDEVAVTRAVSAGQLEERIQSNQSQLTCRNDALHIWNKISPSLKQSNSLNMAKNATKTFVKTIPL